MNQNKKYIAMTDLETSGDIFSIHEILEVGLVVFDQDTFKIIETMDKKVKPENIENAVPQALVLNGYKEEYWKDALSLKDAMTEYAQKTQNCIFCSYNVSFDWGFINKGFFKTNIENHMSTRENHDRLDVLSVAWTKGLKDSPSFSLKTACQMFDIPPEPHPHSALNGAMTAYELWKKLAK